MEEDLWERKFNALKELNYSLGIRHKQRKELVKRCYTCYGKFVGLPKTLNDLIDQAKKEDYKSGKGKLAYKFIKEGLNYFEGSFMREIVRPDTLSNLVG
jgi:hypothetical protein